MMREMVAVKGIQNDYYHILKHTKTCTFFYFAPSQQVRYRTHIILLVIIRFVLEWHSFKFIDNKVSLKKIICQ